MNAVVIGTSLTAGIVVVFLIWSWLQLRRVDRTLGRSAEDEDRGR